MESNSKPKSTNGTADADGDPSPLDAMPSSLSPMDGNISFSWATQAAQHSLPPLSRPQKLTRNERAQTLSESDSFDIGKRVFYIDGDENVHTASIKKTDYDDKMHTYYTIDVNGNQKVDVHHTALSDIHPTVNKVLCVLNLRDETDHFLRTNYPTLKQFECFLKLSFEAIKAFHKINGELKEPRFMRSDRQEFIILRRWTEEKVNQLDGKINWRCFSEESFSDLREQVPKQDLSRVLKELGINNEKVINTLEAKSIQSPSHFVQKPKSWYNKLEVEEESDTEANEQQPEQLLFNGSEKIAIENFKQWYNFHSMGYLPSDWIVSFRNDDIHPKQRDLRNVLRVIGISADAIAALAINDIKDVTTLNRESKWWKTETKRGSSSLSMVDRIPWPWARNGEQESRSTEWKLMGLSRNDASDIISFRHWYTFYVAGKSNMKGWTAEFNSAQYNNFLQKYEPGDNFKPSFWWKFQKHDRLKFSQERHDYYDMLQRAAEAGDVSDKQRYYLMKYYKEKREKVQLVEEIISHHDDGLGDCPQQEERLQELLDLDEKRADEKDKGDLLFGQQFMQFFFSAFLVLVLLCGWFCTTIYFMIEEDWAGFDYVTFIHNVLFGLVTAVVIQELGEEASETSLYYRFLPTYRDQRRRRKEYQILNQLRRRGVRSIWGDIVQLAKSYLMVIILWSTRLYIMCWIFIGAVSLAFGAIEGIDTGNPLYTTGQTWLGIAVTIGYTYFGLSGKVAPEQDGNDKTDERKNDAAIQGTIGGSGSGGGGVGVNGREREEASFTDTDERKEGRELLA